jgi:hypothetical protein
LFGYRCTVLAVIEGDKKEIKEIMQILKNIFFVVKNNISEIANNY